jgi:hypothetical protein
VFSVARYQCRIVVERIISDGRFRFTTESRLENPRRRRASEQTSPKPGGITVDYGEASSLGKYNFMLYAGHMSISPTLGQVLRPIHGNEPPIYYISPISGGTPVLNTVQSLYMYSDIVEHQRGGNTSVQLMDIAPVQGSPGQRAHYVFDPPTYLPVCRNFIEIIHIIIHDGDDGETLFPTMYRISNAAYTSASRPCAYKRLRCNKARTLRLSSLLVTYRQCPQQITVHTMSLRWEVRSSVCS